jgi:hypothetical protein
MHDSRSMSPEQGYRGMFHIGFFRLFVPLVRAKFFASVPAVVSRVLDTSFLDCWTISASFAFTRLVISRLPPVSGIFPPVFEPNNGPLVLLSRSAHSCPACRVDTLSALLPSPGLICQ